MGICSLTCRALWPYDFIIGILFFVCVDVCLYTKEKAKCVKREQYYKDSAIELFLWTSLFFLSNIVLFGTSVTCLEMYYFN